MKYYRDVETGTVYAFSEDQIEDGLVSEAFVELTPEELEAHLSYEDWWISGEELRINPHPRDETWRKATDEEVAAYKAKLALQEEIKRETLWRSAEIAVVKDNLDAILFEDPDALPGTEAEWKGYGVALRKWVDGAIGYPSIENRPKRPMTE